MAGVVALVAGIVIAIFLGGAVFGVIVLVAIKVKSEDKATMRREDRSLTLREVGAGRCSEWHSQTHRCRPPDSGFGQVTRPCVRRGQWSADGGVPSSSALARPVR